MTVSWRRYTTVAALTCASLPTSKAQSNGPDSTFLAHFPQAQYIPWSWYVRPIAADTSKVCPSVGTTLAKYSIVNVLVTCLSLIVGYSSFVKSVTCQYCGKANAIGWMFTWIISVLLHLGANAVLGAIYLREPGYGPTFRIHDLMLFYTTRPRLAWLILTMCMRIGASKSSSDRGWYENTAKQLAIAEVVLNLIACYYVGITAHFGATHGFYQIGNLQGPYRVSAQIFYAGALLFLIGCFGSIVSTLTMVWAMHSSERHVRVFMFLCIAGTSTWLSSWLFWSGYVRLAGDLYCPPQLVAQGAIWTTFSTLGGFFDPGVDLV